MDKIGFELFEVETLGYSANSVVQDNRKKGLKTDFILTFQKKRPSHDTIKILTIKKDKNYLFLLLRKYAKLHFPYGENFSLSLIRIKLLFNSL